MAKNLLTPALNVYEQMALDETVARDGATAPVLRFYHWTQGSAVTFGYSQFLAFVQKQTKPENGPLCRRPTGGGVVFHGDDLTFSLVFQTDKNPKEIYSALHGAIERALFSCAALISERQGSVDAAAYAPVQNGSASGCFVNPVQDDLLLGGQKILGGAIRRFGSVILYQGSLQCPSARENPLFRRAVEQGAAEMLGVSFRTIAAGADLLKQAQQLALSQYVTPAWSGKL